MLTDKSECKSVCWECRKCRNVDVSALQDRETDNRGKRQEELI